MIKKLRLVIILIVSFLIVGTIGQVAESKIVTKQVEVQTKDLRLIKATITYEKIPQNIKFPAVLLVHSLGYTSKDWGKLIPMLNNAGYAVIAMDLRGHGNSIYDVNFHKKSWTYFSNKTYAKMPYDIVSIVNQVQKTEKNINIKNMAIVGADIGANASVIAAKNMKIKPKTMVLISPTRTFKGLYIPLAMTELNFPILTMVSGKDRYCLGEQKILARFSQGGFYAQNYPNGGMGMVMLKVNPTMASDITKWIIKYLR